MFNLVNPPTINRFLPGGKKGKLPSVIGSKSRELILHGSLPARIIGGGMRVL